MKTVKLLPYRPSKKAERFERFARFCVDYGVSPRDVAELVSLAEKAFKAGENYCNNGDRFDGRYERAEQVTGERFELKAKALGFGVQWSGLWPTLLKYGREVYLPTFD